MPTERRDGYTSLVLISMRRFRLLSALSLVGAAMVLISCSREWRDAVQCRKHLRGIALSLDLDRQMNSNAWPRSLIEVDRGLLRKVLVCPGTGNRPGPDLESEAWSDYVYLDWSRLTTNTGPSIAKYPLAFDRRLSNHAGRGINVVLVDGSVFWDDGGRWLAKFSQDHSAFKVPLLE